eukprot:scaffold13811_cov131-Skeletonema_marinoi.AAC.3
MLILQYQGNYGAQEQIAAPLSHTTTYTLLTFNHHEQRKTQLLRHTPPQGKGVARALRIRLQFPSSGQRWRKRYNRNNTVESNN